MQLDLTNPLVPAILAIVMAVGWVIWKKKNQSSPQSSPEPQASTGPLQSVLSLFSGSKLGGAAALFSLLMNHKQLLTVGLKVFQYARDWYVKLKASNEPITPEKVEKMVADAVAAATNPKDQPEDPSK